MNWERHGKPAPPHAPPQQPDLSWIMPVATQMAKPGQGGQEPAGRQAHSTATLGHTTTGPTMSGSFLPAPPPLVRYPGATAAAQPQPPHSLVSSQGAFPPNRVSTSANPPVTSQPSFPAQPPHAQQARHQPRPQMPHNNQRISAPNHSMGAPNHSISATNHGLGSTNHGLGSTTHGLGPPNHSLGAANHSTATPRTAHQQMPQPAPQFAFMPSIPNIREQLSPKGSGRQAGHQPVGRGAPNVYPGVGPGGLSQAPQMPRQSSPHLAQPASLPQQQFSPPPVQQHYTPARHQMPATLVQQQQERARHTQAQYQPSSTHLQTGAGFPPGRTPATYTQPTMRPGPTTAPPAYTPPGNQPRYSQPGGAGAIPRPGQVAPTGLPPPRQSFPQPGVALPRQPYGHQTGPQPRQPFSQRVQAPRMPAPAHQHQAGPLPRPPPYRPRGSNPGTVRQPGNMYPQPDQSNNPAAQVGGPSQPRFPNLQEQLQKTTNPQMTSSAGDYRPTPDVLNALNNLQTLNQQSLLLMTKMRQDNEARQAGRSNVPPPPVTSTPSSGDNGSRIRTAFAVPMDVPEEPNDKAILGRWYAQPSPDDDEEPLAATQPGPVQPTHPSLPTAPATSHPASTLPPPYNVPTPADIHRPAGIPLSDGPQDFICRLLQRDPTSVQVGTDVGPGLPGVPVSARHPIGGAGLPPGMVQTGPPLPGKPTVPGQSSAPPAEHGNQSNTMRTPDSSPGVRSRQSADDEIIVPSLRTEEVIEYKVADLLRYLTKFTGEYKEEQRKSQEGDRSQPGRKSLEQDKPVQDRRTSLDTQKSPLDRRKSLEQPDKRQSLPASATVVQEGAKTDSIECGTISGGQNVISALGPIPSEREKVVSTTTPASDAFKAGVVVEPTTRNVPTRIEPTRIEPTRIVPIEEQDLADGLTATSMRVTQQLMQMDELFNQQNFDFTTTPTPVVEEQTKVDEEAERTKARLQAKQALEAKQAELMKETARLEAERVKKQLEAEQVDKVKEAQARLQMEAKLQQEALQVKARFEAGHANIQRELRLQQEAEKVRMKEEAEQAKQTAAIPVTVTEEMETAEMAQPIIEYDNAEYGYIGVGRAEKTGETVAVYTPVVPGEEAGSLVPGGVGKKRKREGSDVDSDTTANRGSKRAKGARGSGRARGRGKPSPSLTGQSGRGQARGRGPRARGRGQNTHTARGKATAGGLLAGAVSQTSLDTPAQPDQPARGPRGGRGYRGYGRGRGRGQSRARGRGSKQTHTPDRPSSQPTMDRFLDTLQLTPTKPAASNPTESRPTTHPSTDHTPDLPQHQHQIKPPKETNTTAKKHRVTSPGVTKKKKGKTKVGDVSEDGEQSAREGQKMETDDDASRDTPQLAATDTQSDNTPQLAATDTQPDNTPQLAATDTQPDNTLQLAATASQSDNTPLPDQYSQQPVHKPEQSEISETKVDRTVCDSAPRDRIAEDVSTTSEGGDLAATLTVVPVETIKITDSHKMTWIRFHGKVTTRLITDDGNFFLVKEIFRRCFRIQAAEKRTQMMKIHTIMRTVLKIKETQLPGVMLPFVIKNLKKRKVIKTVPETFMMVREEDAMALFHHIYKDRYCIDACSATFYKDARRASDDTTMSDTGHTLTTGASLPATPERQIHDPLRRDDVQSPLTPNRNIFDVIVGGGSPDKRRSKSPGSGGKGGKRGRELINLCSDSDADGYDTDTTLPYVDGRPLKSVMTEDVEETAEETGEQTPEVTTIEAISGDKARETTAVITEVVSLALSPDTDPVIEKHKEKVNKKMEETLDKPEEIVEEEDQGPVETAAEIVENDEEVTVQNEPEEIVEKEIPETAEVADEHADYKVCHEAVKVSLISAVQKFLSAGEEEPIIVLDSDASDEETDDTTHAVTRRSGEDGTSENCVMSALCVTNVVSIANAESTPDMPNVGDVTKVDGVGNDGDVTMVDASEISQDSHGFTVVDDVINVSDVVSVGDVTNDDDVTSEDVTNDDVTIVEEKCSNGNSKMVQERQPSKTLENNSGGENSEDKRTCDVSEQRTSDVDNHTNVQSRQNSMSKEGSRTDRDLMSPVECIKKLTDSLIAKQDSVQMTTKTTEQFKGQNGSKNPETKNPETSNPETKTAETLSEKSSDGEIEVEVKGRVGSSELPFSCDLADMDISAYERKVRECIEKANRTDDMDELADVCFEVLEITKPLEELPRKYLAQIDQYAITGDAFTQDERQQLLADLPKSSQQIVIDLEAGQDSHPQHTHGNPSDLDNGT